MTKSDVFRVWGRVLSGRSITKECPLLCPGCYAYSPDHLGEGINLRQLSDLKGPALVDEVVALVERLRPVRLSIIGGEPLVRYRELDELLPKLACMNVEVQLVTSAISQPGALDEFCRFWSAVPEVRKIWFSLYMPQQGEVSEERLTGADRVEAVRQIGSIRDRFPKLDAPRYGVEGFLSPPDSPEFGGQPVCTECGCVASVGMAAVAGFRLAGLVPLSSLLAASQRVGALFAPDPLPASRLDRAA
jgi:hypothetical protein